MAARRPSYLFAPNWDFPPGSAIALGNIIKDVKRPDRALYVANVDPNVVTTTMKSMWAYDRGDERSGRLGIWASVLAPILGLSADVAGHATRGNEDVFKCEKLETKYFVPDDAFIGNALRTAIVRAYTDAQWRKAVYMITGLKIAHGASLESKANKGHGGEGKVGVDGTSVGAPGSIGPELQYDHTNTTGTKFTTDEPFVLAYQVLKIKPKRDGQMKTETFNKAALLSDDVDDLAREREQSVRQIHHLWEIEQLELDSSGDIALNSAKIISDQDLDCDFLIIE